MEYVGIRDSVLYWLLVRVPRGSWHGFPIILNINSFWNICEASGEHCPNRACMENVLTFLTVIKATLDNANWN